MITREQKIERVYEEISGSFIVDYRVDDFMRNWVGKTDEFDEEMQEEYDNLSKKREIHYGYAVDWIEKNINTYGRKGKWIIADVTINDNWKDKTQPIEHESNSEALDYIFNLIENAK